MRAIVRRDRYSLVGTTVRPSPVVNFLVPFEASQLFEIYTWVGSPGCHTDGKIVQVEHGDPSLHKGPRHFHSVSESTKSHVSIRDNWSQEVKFI